MPGWENVIREQDYEPLMDDVLQLGKNRSCLPIGFRDPFRVHSARPVSTTSMRSSRTVSGGGGAA